MVEINESDDLANVTDLTNGEEDNQFTAVVASNCDGRYLQQHAPTV